MNTTANESQPMILVIDDDDVNRIVLERLFAREHIRVSQAEDGEQGIALAREVRPDIILLDIFMPGEDGFEVLTRFKADPDLCDIPVCIFSILQNEESRQKAFALGACSYIPKPFDMKDVVVQIKKQLL